MVTLSRGSATRYYTVPKWQHFRQKPIKLAFVLLGISVILFVTHLHFAGQQEEKHGEGSLLEYEAQSVTVNVREDKEAGRHYRNTKDEEGARSKMYSITEGQSSKNPVSHFPVESSSAVPTNAQQLDNTTTDSPGLSVRPTSPYAYTFMIGGATPEDFGSYRGSMYNILIAQKILRERGSTADVVLWCQISSKTNATRLPGQHEDWLSKSGIQLRYFPKTKVESFIDIIMEKFRVLSMVEYKRVLFLDSDVLPMGNLDYFFTLSDPAAPPTKEYWNEGFPDTRGKPPVVLKENVILAGLNVPMCAGFFMVSPRPGDYVRVQQLIHQKFLNGYKRDMENEDNDILIDPVEGWGHRITRPDYWMTRKGRHFREWAWYDVEADQGLGYHWPKYEKKSVSIIYFNKIEQWGADEKGNLVMEELVARPFDRYSNSLIMDYHICKKYLCDHHHFDASEKPWVVGPPRDVDYSDKHQVDEKRLKSPLHLWYHTLFELNEELSIGANLMDWKREKMMPLKSHFKWGIKIRNKMAAIQEGIAEESILYEGKYRLVK